MFSLLLTLADGSNPKGPIPAVPFEDNMIPIKPKLKYRKRFGWCVGRHFGNHVSKCVMGILLWYCNHRKINYVGITLLKIIFARYRFLKLVFSSPAFEVMFTIGLLTP